MSRVYLGPTSAYALGQIGELTLLSALDGDVFVPSAVVEAVDVEPAATNLAEFLAGEDVDDGIGDADRDRAREILGDGHGDAATAVVAGVLARRDADDRDHDERDAEDRTAVGVVSSDRTVRRVSHGLGAVVTSGFGVVVRAAVEDKYLSPTQAKRIVRRMDKHGPHMTGELRERAIGEIE